MNELHVIGRVETISFPKLGLEHVPARIDTGAKTSAVWASSISVKDGVLGYKLFGPGSTFYTGKTIRTKAYTQRAVSTSTGQVELRYMVRRTVVLEGRKIRASFTLANRSEQVYPVLVGRNILRGKFIVNVRLGKPSLQGEKLREQQKWASLEADRTNRPRKEQS